MSGRRVLGMACVLSTLLAVYACGGDDDVVIPPDGLTDASQRDGGRGQNEASLADGNTTSPPLPGASLALGEGFGCIVAADNSVYCWGRNDVGQLGRDPAATPSCGAYPCTPLPAKVEGLSGVVALAAGKDFVCALDDVKKVWCWGNNAKGQIMRTGIASRFTPEVVAERANQVVAAGQHACIRNTDGYLGCWGDNDCDLFGGSSDGGAVGYISLVSPQSKHVSLGPDAMCSVTADTGEIYCWGADHKGSLGHPLPSNAGTCAGGRPYDPSPKRWVSDAQGRILTGAEDVHVGRGITCARKTDGTTLCAGDNSHGGLGQGLPDSDTHFVALEVPFVKASSLLVAGETACAVTNDSLLCWGDARYGQMPAGDPMTTCSGTGCRPLGYVIPGQTNLRNVALGPANIGTVKNDVSVWLWGRNDSGETGVARDDASNSSCTGGVACIGSPRQKTNLPALK